MICFLDQCIDNVNWASILVVWPLVVTQVATVHPENPKREGSRTPDGELLSTMIEDIHATFRTVAWQRLKILDSKDGSDGEGIVQFLAYFKVVNQKGQRQKGNVLQCLHETSTFRQDSTDGAWKYLGGETNVTVESR